MLQSQRIIDAVKEKCAQAAEPLAHVAEAGAEAVHTFLFDVSGLEDFSTKDIRQDATHKADFDQLAAIKRPVVYVFEIVSATSPSEVLAAARLFSDSGNLRVMPAFRKEIDDTSSVLYVGKVKSGFAARVIQHLGFGRTAATQGLQMYHWTRGLDLQLRLTAFEFRNEMADLLPLLEKAVARELKPLLGKHQ